jgi:DNA (cytosine-5)-methyltransferase 1
MTPRLLDLFCGAGGCARGYQRAGFYVVGVDNRPQPRYAGDEFVQMDALEAVGDWTVGEFDAIHASPPCQRYTIAQNARKNASAHPDLIGPVRDLLVATGLPYVIENVKRAPLRNPVELCGTSFGLGADGFELRRHRLFECSFAVMAPPCWHQLPAAPVFGHNAGRDFVRRYGRGFTAAAKAEAMGIDWMNRDEVSEAVPPAMAEHVGTYLFAEVQRRRLERAATWREAAWPRHPKRAA